MSQTAQGDTADVEIKKTVQVVAYLDNSTAGSVRSIASEVFPDVNWYEMDTNTHTKHILEKNGTEERIEKSTYELLKDVQMENAELRKEEVETESHKFQERHFSKLVRDEVWGMLPDETAGKYQREDAAKRYTDEDFNKGIGFYNRADEMGLLKHPSEITPDDVFKDDSERPVLKWKVKVQADSRTEMEQMTDEVVQVFINLISTLDYIERIRWYDCEQQTKEKGVCMRL